MYKSFMPKHQVRKKVYELKSANFNIFQASENQNIPRPMYASWKCTKTLLSNIRFKVAAKKVQLVISIKDLSSSKRKKGSVAIDWKQ